MKKYITILGLTLVMASQSVFGMETKTPAKVPAKAPAKVPAKIATAGDNAVMNELTKRLRRVSLTNTSNTPPKPQVVQATAGTVTTEHRPSLSLPPRIPVKTGGAVTSEQRPLSPQVPVTDKPNLSPRLPATGDAGKSEQPRLSLDTTNLSPRTPVTDGAVTGERRVSFDSPNLPPRVPAKIGARKSSAEDKYYEQLAKNYYEACLNTVYAACGPNVSSEQKKVLRQVLGETLQDDMKQCSELCDQALEVCQATIQKCQGMQGQTAIDASNKMWETYPAELAGYTFVPYSDDDGSVDETSFLYFTLGAMFETLKDKVRSGTIEEFDTVFPLVTTRHLHIIPHAKKLAEAVLTFVKRKKNTTQTTRLKIILQPTVDAKQEQSLLWSHEYVHDRTDIVLAAYGPHAEEYKAMLMPTIKGIIQKDMMDCLTLINEFMPTLRPALEACEEADEKEAFRISSETIQAVPQELKRYFIEVDQDPYCFYIGKIRQANCAKALKKKRSEVTNEEVDKWFGEKYPLKVTQLTMVLKYAQTFAYQVLEALGVQNIHLD